MTTQIGDVKALCRASARIIIPVIACVVVTPSTGTGISQAEPATIVVHTTKRIGPAQPLLFGHFIEHEHNTIDGGLSAELLRDRKFEEGEVKPDGVANEWQPEERIQDRYWELDRGRGRNHRYFVDHQVFYGGGAAQAIELTGTGQPASIYQIGLHLARARPYIFYVYLKTSGGGSALLEFDRAKGPIYKRTQISAVSRDWTKYTSLFVSPEDTTEARVRIGVMGTGTFWMDSASLMPADNWHGMRRDVIEAMRPLRIPVMRYPGGCFADYYDWKLGIGPRDQRPEFWGTAWDEWNQNDFGFDDYMLLASELGFEGHITTNYVSGTPQTAAAWVQYANGKPDTPMGRLRAQNGHPPPYNVRYWAVGNEAPDLCSEQYTGGTTLQRYAQRFREYSTAMREVDPSIHIMASSVGDPAWVRQMISVLHPELIASSIYTGTQGQTKCLCDPTYYYRHVVAEPVEFEHKLMANLQSVTDVAADHPYFAVTEWNSWWLPETEDPDYRLSTALYYAGVFNVLLRHSRQVLLAEVSTTLNVQGIIEINPVSIKLTPPYMAFLLYRNHIGDEVVDSLTAGPMAGFNAGLPALDAVATLSSDRRTIYLSVTNRDDTQDLMASLDVRDWTLGGSVAVAYELSAATPDASNPYGSTSAVHIQEKRVALTAGAPPTYRFPAHSVTVLELKGTPSS